MKFQAILFMLFALASSFLSLCTVVCAEDNLTTLAPPNANVSTAQSPPASDTNSVPPANATGSNSEVNNNNTNNVPPANATGSNSEVNNNNNNTSPTTVAVAGPTTTLTSALSSVTVSNDTVNQTESRNTTEAPPQNIVVPTNATATPTTTTQSPRGVSEACLQGWRNHSIEDFCQGKSNESVAKCDGRELDILYKHECWVIDVINANGRNVSKKCLQRVTECLSNTADSSAEDIRNNFCRQDKSPSDCFTKGDNSSSSCSSEEYQVFRNASDCSSSRRVAEACTLIVLLASVVALALTSE